MPKIDPAACPERSGSGYPDPYDAPCRARRWRQIAVGSGLTDFGANLVTVPPGAWSSQRHWHDLDDELMIMTAGELTLVDDAGRHPMRTGDIAAFPKNDGNGHHLINEGEAEASFLVIGANKGATAYPDIDLVAHSDADIYHHKDGTPYEQ